jgi:hypothetical protein
MALTLIAGCSGPSSYNSAADPPQAVAHLIGAQPTSAAGVDPVTVTIRSQSQLTLTGNASSGGAGAIGNFLWQQTDSPSTTPQVTLLYLDADTVTFTAPKVGQDTTLHFTLTVTTAENTPATAHVAVLVKAINDPNQFLAQPTTIAQPAKVQHHFNVAVATVEGLGALATPAATLAANVPVCVTVSRAIHYTSRDGNVHDGTAYPAVTLPALHQDTAWSAAEGGAPVGPAPGGFSSYTNPRVSFDIPALNQDDLAVLFNNPIPGESASATAARLAQQLVPADIDKASLSLTATVAPGSCDGTMTTTALSAKTLQLQVLDENGNAVGSAGASATFTPDDLVSQQANTQYETAETAQAYYAAIDPTQSKSLFSNWLTANCFDPSKSDYGADAHAVYTNNFDLGFGRDMYFTTCKAGTPNAGDMASVVINYASLEAAAGKLNPVIAVAMEYGRAAGASSGRRFPKFYVFAPDDRDGTFHRVSSANFDHRGEKYVPGACLLCHSGNVPAPATAKFNHLTSVYPTLADPTANATGQLALGDVDAIFMPWDLDSFLYASAPLAANTDPSFVGLSVNPALYSRAAQEPNLKKLNQLTYCTWQPEIESIGNGQTADRLNTYRALVSRWYGGAAGPDGSTYPTDAACASGAAPTASLLPNSTYDDADSTPAGWKAQSAAQQKGTPPTTSDQLYHQVFARNCRACHAGNPLISDQFADYPTFIQFFQSQQQAGVTAPGVGLQYTLKQGRMPLARLTMDRFWVDFSGGNSAATVLAAHVQAVNGETDLINSSTGVAVPPGAPVVFASVSTPNIASSLFTPYGTNALTIPRFGGVLLDASFGFLIENYTWSLCLIPPAPAAGVCAPQPQRLIGSSAATLGIATDAPGQYNLKLTADNGVGGTTTTPYTFTVLQKTPSLSGCPTTASNTTTTTPNSYGPTATVSFSSCITGGDEPNNQPNSFQIQDPISGWVTVANEPSLPWTASTSASYNAVTSTYSYSLSFAFDSLASGNVTLPYRVTDVDGDSVSGTIQLVLTDSLMAGGGTIPFTSPPASSYPIPVSSLSNTIVPPSDTGVTLIVPPNFASLPATVTPPPNGTVQFPLGGSVPATPVPLTGSFTYTPPSGTFLTCDINGYDITAGFPTPCVGDTFWYYLLSGDGTTTSSNVAEVTVKIKAATSFNRTGTANDIYQVLAVCESCHVGSSNSSANANYHWAYDSATDGTGPPTTYNSIKGTDTTSNILGLDWTTHDPGGAPTSTPSAAALYANPCVSTSTHYANEFHFTDTTSCPLILKWIEDGARND